MRDYQKTLEEFNTKYPLKSFEFNQKTWKYVVKGIGTDTVVIFPGGGQDAQSPYGLISSLEPFYKVISISIYNADSIEEFCMAVDAILEKEKTDKLIVYGLSLGALLAQAYTKRNLNRVKGLIISHGTAPKSVTYQKKIIIPLQILSIFLPIIPQSVVRLIARSFSGKVQGNSRQDAMKNYKPSELQKALVERYYKSYLTKRLLKTWISLHLDFYKHEQFNIADYDNWRGSVLIIRTDNDPLMQDDGEFKKIYPSAIVYTLTGSGHLSFHYKADEILRVIKDFLQTIKRS